MTMQRIPDTLTLRVIDAIHALEHQAWATTDMPTRKYLLGVARKLAKAHQQARKVGEVRAVVKAAR